VTGLGLDRAWRGRLRWGVILIETLPGRTTQGGWVRRQVNEKKKINPDRGVKEGNHQLLEKPSPDGR